MTTPIPTKKIDVRELKLMRGRHELSLESNGVTQDESFAALERIEEELTERSYILRNDGKVVPLSRQHAIGGVVYNINVARSYLANMAAGYDFAVESPGERIEALRRLRKAVSLLEAIDAIEDPRADYDGIKLDMLPLGIVDARLPTKLPLLADEAVNG